VGYVIDWSNPAAKALRKLDQREARRILVAVDALAEDPRPHGVKALQGYPGALRLRVGDYRVVYEVDDGALRVLVVTVAHRREVYRW
jgi:mRNA interferase RelE/StbE